MAYQGERSCRAGRRFPKNSVWMMQTATITDTHHVELVVSPWWLVALAALVAFAIGYLLARKRDP